MTEFVQPRRSRIFTILYFSNLGILVACLMSPIFDFGSVENFKLQLFAVGTFLAFSLCPTFMALNIYGILKLRKNPIAYGTIVVVLLAWIVCGVFIVIHAYRHEWTL